MSLTLAHKKINRQCQFFATYYYQGKTVMIRKAKIPDVKIIHSLLSEYGSKGELLSRPLSELYDHVRDFFVYENPETGEVQGCGALQFCWEDLAEIRSLAVRQGCHGEGIGTLLVNTAIAEAVSFGIKELFTLTYRPDFFKPFGFTLIDRSDLPLKIWSDCVSCVKFPDCDENAMMKKL
jgi:amino-acid N-acetyltransferase